MNRGKKLLPVHCIRRKVLPRKVNGGKVKHTRQRYRVSATAVYRTTFRIAPSARGSSTRRKRASP